MPQSLFISYVHEDRAYRDQVKDWARRGLLGANVVVTGESEDVRQHGEAAIRNHLQPLIRGCATLVCLIGDNSHNHAWVQHELSVASSLGKRVVLVRLPNTTGRPPGHHASIPLVDFSPGAIKQAL
jgi:hypothetical protein